MNERSILEVQIQSMFDELTWVETALGKYRIDPAVYKGAPASLKRIDLARASLVNEIKKQWESLTQAREQLECNASLGKCWNKFSGVRESSRPLLRECLAYLEGIFVREAGLDAGLCDIADAMLSELRDRVPISWERFTVLAEEEFFADLAQIIRLRFPIASIWNLPVAGHELGHFAAQAMESLGTLGNYRHPFREILDKEGASEHEMRYLHEHFADIFATFTLGPAFVCTCILARFDPETAYNDVSQPPTQAHPAPAKRVYVMLETLQEMNAAGGGVSKPYQGIVDDLRDVWQRCLRAAGSPSSLDEALTKHDVVKLKQRFEYLYALLNDELPGSRYPGWARVLELSNALMRSESARESLKAGGAIADVLNAAWKCRLRYDERGLLREIAERAVAFCQEIMFQNA
jgi:hypothetical protein